MPNPKRIKQRNPKEQRQKKKLTATKELTTREVGAAMAEASQAIDHLSQEVQALKRIIVAERAQVIYYTERALAFMKRETAEVTLVNFADLPEDKQQRFVVQAIKELGSDESPSPKKGPSLIV
jgi:hypothetical protein